MVNIPKIAETASHIFNISGLLLYLYVFRLDVLLGFYVEVKVLRWSSYENKYEQLEMFDNFSDCPLGISDSDWVPFWLSIRERTYAELANSFEKEYRIPNLLISETNNEKSSPHHRLNNGPSVIDAADGLH